MKIVIHPLTYIILLSILLCGYFNYFLIISIILIVHDLGHLFFMKLFHIYINKIEILPFGSMIHTDIKYNIESNKLFLISSGGVLFQLILNIIFYLLIKYSLLSNYSYQIFLTYNKLIIIFNLLPIIPLDGSKIFISLIERFLSYKRSLIIVNIISIILIIILIFNQELSLNLILVSFFLFYKSYYEIFNHAFIFHKFLLERYLNNYKYPKIKKIKKIKDIYKNKFNFINNEREDKYLAKIFDIKKYF